MKNRSTFLFLVIAIICLALGVVAVIVMRNYVPSITGSTVGGDSSKAKTRCEEVVRASLRSQDEGKFRSQKIVSLSDNRYQVTGTIDGPNATGVIVRGSYICIFNFTTKSFDKLSLEGDDDIWKPLQK
jgi:hypothetical protein